MKQCQHCHKSESLLINSVSKTGKIGYMCRKCNTERLKKYRSTKKGRNIVYKSIYASIARYPQKQRARMALNVAVKRGEIEKPKKCSCGHPKVEGHHNDYNKPLEVIWLCRSCHADLHKVIDKV